MKTLLLDTGPVIALMDKADPDHRRVATAWSALNPGGPLVTSAAVITEIFQYFQDADQAAERVLRFLVDARVRVENTFSPGDLQSAVFLMNRYGDTPMDFADATLVLLAERFQSGGILTLDQRGFATTDSDGIARFTFCSRTPHE